MIRRAARLASTAIVAVIVVAWAVAFRPQQLGGPATYVVVRGSSMLPLYKNGDLVITQSSARYGPGDVVAYRVPAGEVGAGHLVIHRIVGLDGRGGFVVRGDNNRFDDPWTPSPTDIAGKAWLAVPGVGRVIAVLQQPVIAGGLAMSIAITVMLARPPSIARLPRPERAPRPARPRVATRQQG